MTDFNLYPLNDLAFFAKLKDINSATGEVSNLTTGTVTCFLATASTPAATAADPTLSNTATHLSNGKWLVFFDASVLTASLLATHFASTAPILIIQYPNGFRVYYSGTYSESRAGTVG
jgi:hypothetical protein